MRTRLFTLATVLVIALGSVRLGAQTTPSTPPNVVAIPAPSPPQDWFIPGNWNTDAVPTATDDVGIGLGTAAIDTVQIAADITAVARTVTLGVVTGTTYTPGALDVTSDILTITPPTGFANPALQVLSGSALTISGGGSVNVGTFAVDNFGTININADNSGATLAAGTVHNESSGIIEGGLAFAAGGTVTNAGQITGLNGAFNGEAITVTGGTANIANSGTITGTNGVEADGGGLITNNAGTIQGTDGPGVIASAAAFDATPPPLTIVNSGTISGTTVGIELDGGGSITNNSWGIIAGPANAAVTSTGGPTTFSNAGSITGSVTLGDSLTFANQATLVTGGTISGDLNLGTNTATTLTLTGVGSETLSQAVAGVITNDGSVIKQGSGTWVIDKPLGNYAGGTTISAGTLTDALTNALSAGPISVAGNTSFFQINPGVTVANPISLTGGASLNNSGTISATPGGLISGAGGGNVTNEGTGVITNNAGSAVVFNAGGTLTNMAGGLVQSGTASGVNSLAGTTTITNSGTISGLTGISLATGGSVINNTGGVITGKSGLAISSTGGSTTIANSGTINGNVSLANFPDTVQLFTGGRINGSLNLGTSPGGA